MVHSLVRAKHIGIRSSRIALTLPWAIDKKGVMKDLTETNGLHSRQPAIDASLRGMEVPGRGGS